ncbi:hypothetical protein HYT05_00805 [Candidatus Kaiserbacteria bacterium]|nr:hypothetical protein [Candidatus Kaiserbacteria bacterium]
MDPLPSMVFPPLFIFSIPVDPVIDPSLTTLPFSVNVFVPISKILPELIVRPAFVLFAASVTLFPPVVAITTLSPLAGADPPTQVDPVAQSPPVAVLVMVAAKAKPAGAINIANERIVGASIERSV